MTLVKYSNIRHMKMTSPGSRLNSNSRLARLALAGATSTLFLVAAGCSSSTTASTTTQQPASTGAQHISLVASTPATTTEVFSAKPGSVTVSFAVPSNVPHGLQVESPSGAVVGQIAAFENGTKSVTVSVTTGSYTIWCLTNGQTASIAHARINVQ